MADKRIQDLTQATSIQLNDLFVLEQSGAAKSLTGQTLVTDLATYLSGHGGISNITYTPPVPPSLNGTLDITMADASTYSVTITNGNGIDTIDIEYGISNSGTDPIYVVSWESSPVAPTDQYPYGWTRIAITDTTGNTTNAYSVTVKADDPTVSIGSVSAVSGGSPSATVTNSGTPQNPVLDFDFVFQQGDKGDTGDYIEPVVSYGTSTAAATEPVTWYNSPTSISYVAGNFIWKKTEYVMHDAQTVQDTVKEIIGYIGQNGAGSGTVNQITLNGTVYTDDGTGNVDMTVDAADVGAIGDPSTKSNGQVLTYDSSAGEWVAANPTTGNVNTVNNKGVDVGTTNITLYGTDIAMSSSDPTTVQAAIPARATATPSALGTAAIGSSTKYATEDHVHPMPSNTDVGVDFKVYDSVSDIGLTSGSATIAGAWSALSANEILICEASDFTTSTGGVPSTLGTVEIIHYSGGRGSITFYGKEAGNADYRMYLNSSNVPTGDWVRMAEVLDLGTFTSTAKSFTLPAASNYLIGTTHASSAVSVGLWIYSTSGSTFFNLAGGSTITLTGNGTSFTAKSGGATVGLYAIRLR